MHDRCPQGAAAHGWTCWPHRLPVGVLAVCLLAQGCSMKRFAVRQVADALSSGTSTFETDRDTELVGDALPFSLKLMESLLEITPNHVGLLVAAAKGFSLYAWAYVDFPGEMAMEEDFERGRHLRQRAQRLYARALGYAMRALARAYPGISEQFGTAPREAVRRVRPRHVDLLYWTGAALGLSISADPTNPALVVRLGQVDALLDRALELEEDWDRGALHEFRLRLESARPGGASRAELEDSFSRALELSQGQRAGLFVAYAEAAALPAQDRSLFDEMIERALAVDADSHEQDRLLNHLAQQRARWLLSRVDDLFF